MSRAPSRSYREAVARRAASIAAAKASLAAGSGSVFGTPPPWEVERAAGNAAMAERQARAEPIDTAPPLTTDELRKRQQRQRKDTRDDRRLTRGDGGGRYGNFTEK